MQRTSIEWTAFTANPVKYRNAAGQTVWACVHASQGCQHCYAERLAQRWGRGGPFTVPAMSALTPYVDEAELRQMLGLGAAAGQRCFIGDMTDICGPWVEDEMLAQVFAAMALRRDVTWQVLTKRPERLEALLTGQTFRSQVAEWVEMLAMGDEGCDPIARRTDDLRATATDLLDEDAWPIANIQIGVSAEDQASADQRIASLLRTPAAIRFVSCEPLLAPIDLRPYLRRARTMHVSVSVEGALANRQFEFFTDDAGQPLSPAAAERELRRAIAAGVRFIRTTAECVGFSPETGCPGHPHAAVEWVIVGGETFGRPCHVDWIRAIVQAGARADRPIFVKQLGTFPIISNEEDCRTWAPHVGKTADRRCEPTIWREPWPWRPTLRNRRGADPAEWPADVRVREFPTASGGRL